MERDSRLATLDEELKQLRAELAAARAANDKMPDPHDYSEAETRTLLIDLELKRAGWPLDQPRDREYEVTGMPNNSGRGFVDDVLWGDDGKPLGIVETMKTTVDARVGQQQAKLYADYLEAMTGLRPEIFYTNGYDTWIWDDVFYPPRKALGFYKNEELHRLIRRRKTRKPLATTALSTTIIDRYYQRRAIGCIGEVFTQGRRKSLLVMATGSGKTRTVIALVDLPEIPGDFRLLRLAAGGAHRHATGRGGSEYPRPFRLGIRCADGCLRVGKSRAGRTSRSTTGGAGGHEVPPPGESATTSSATRRRPIGKVSTGETKAVSKARRTESTPRPSTSGYSTRTPWTRCSKP